MSTVIIPGKLVSKANHYRIHRNASGKEWVAPSDEAKTYQDMVAWQFHLQEKREWRGAYTAIPLQITIRLINQRHDIDGVKGILDGIEQSGRIMNDRQFRKITIEHVDGKTPSVELEVENYETRIS